MEAGPLFVILEVDDRASAGFVESALITILKEGDYASYRKINFKNSDKGGTGPRREETKYQTHDCRFSCQCCCLMGIVVANGLCTCTIAYTTRCRRSKRNTNNTAVLIGYLSTHTRQYV